MSVVIPSYNSAPFVGEAIGSVLAQTFSDWELIVVDDGSTDNTRAVVAAFTDPRIRYLWQENRERSAARNAGIRAARGRYIAFLDADDAWLPDKLRRQVEAMERQPEVGLVYTGALVVENGRAFHEQRPRHRGQVLRALLAEDNIVTGSGASPLVRASCLARVGGFDERLSVCEDWELWLRLARHFPFDFVAEPLVRVRVHPNNTQRQAAKMARGTLAFFDRVFQDPTLQADLRPIRRRVASLRDFMVGRSFYAARDMAQARRWFLRSLLAWPLQGRAWQYLARSLAGPRLTERLRAARNALAHALRFRRV